MNIKFLLSDLDGVIRMYPPERAASIEQKHGLQAGAIFSHAFEKTLLSKAVCGHITDEVWRTEIAKSLAKVCGETTATEAFASGAIFLELLIGGILIMLYQNFLVSQLRYSQTVLRD